MGSEILKAAPERAIPEVVRVKLKIKWRPLEAEDARNMEYPKKVAGNKQQQPRREAMWIAGLTKASETHTMLPCALHALHVGSVQCLPCWAFVLLWSHPSLLCPILCLEWECPLRHSIMGVHNLFAILQVLTGEICLKSQKTLWA
jgi:hypothetical protein